MFENKNDELIYEIDMASAQPSILILEYLSSTKDYDICIKEKTESEMCLKILLEGNVYKHIQENSSYFKELSNKDLNENSKNLKCKKKQLKSK